MKENVLYRICKIIYTVLLKILFRPKAYGKENIPNEGALIFAGNHRHAFDPVVVMSNTKRQVHYMAKEEIFKGIHGLIFKNIGLIKVNRNQSNPGAVLSAEQILKNGGTIGIFPEGTINRTENKILKFRTGAVRIAKNTNTKILPFAIRGKYKLFRKGIEIEFGKPIDVSNMEVEKANSYLEQEVLKLYNNVK